MHFNSRSNPLSWSISTKSLWLCVTVLLVLWSYLTNSGRERSLQARYLCTILEVTLNLLTHLAFSILRTKHLILNNLDGAGLFCGVVRHLLERGPNCPKVLVATHFHDVFREDLLDPVTVPVSFCHMQVMFTSSDGSVLGSKNNNSTTDGEDSNIDVRKVTVGEKITYLYRLVIMLWSQSSLFDRL